jgi:hypothetical protein
MDWVQISVSILCPILLVAFSYGSLKSRTETKIEGLETKILWLEKSLKDLDDTLVQSRVRIHELINMESAGRLQAHKDLAHLRQEMHAGYVTLVQFEGFVNQVRADQSELKQDTKRLLEMVARLSVKHDG